MPKITYLLLFVLFYALPIAAQPGFNVTDNGASVIISNSYYTLEVIKEKFLISLKHSNGILITEAHSTSGLTFQGGDAESSTLQSHDDTKVKFLVVNTEGSEAEVILTPKDHSLRLSIKPVFMQGSEIYVRMGTLGSAVFGLGDDGIKGNLFGNSFNLKNDGGHDRFITSFSICPEKSFAQVSMIQGDERSGDIVSNQVTLNSSETKIGGSAVSELKYIYFFIGNMHQIFLAYKEAKVEGGYPDFKPHFQLIGGIGWEAWPSLRKNTSQSTVTGLIQEFIDRGYPMKWGVIGSGFFETGGSTTSFGRWNNTTFPNPSDMVNWFHERDMALMVGLRTNFVLGTPEASEALSNDFLAKDISGTPFSFKTTWQPNGEFYVMDGFNESALTWWKNKCDLWGVDGWKEDIMVHTTPKIYHDGFVNKPMEILHNNNDLVMARNGYVAAPGSILRINDTFGETPRIPALALAYGASGAPNVYTDAVGNGNSGETYLVRHSILSSLTAGMAIGLKPWDYSPASESAMYNAAKWHYTYGAYIYSAALKSYESGYPYTLTPLSIAYPGDGQTYNLTNEEKWEWMVGESLLAHPAFANAGWTRDVYLPEGKWIDFTTKVVHQGPKTLAGLNHPMSQIPVFVGGKGVLIRRDSIDDQKLNAEVWPIANGGSQFTYHHFDGVKKSVITNNNPSWDSTQIDIWDKTDMIKIDFQMEAGGVIVFSLIPGHDYQLLQSGTMSTRQNDNIQPLVSMRNKIMSIRYPGKFKWEIRNTLGVVLVKNRGSNQSSNTLYQLEPGIYNLNITGGRMHYDKKIMILNRK